MTVKYSRALLNEVTGGKSVRVALEDMVLDIYDGACPTNPEDARTGTKLARYTLSGGAVEVTDRSTPQMGSILINSHLVTDTFDIDVTVDGVGPTSYNFLGSAPSSDTVALIARYLARMLNDIPQLSAISNGVDTVYVQHRIAGQTFTIADGGSTTPCTVVSEVVAAVRKNTLQFSKPTAGVISKPAGETWQDSSNNATGVAGYFTLCTPDDTIAADPTYLKKRVQGTLATVGGDATIDPATVTALAVSTITTFSLTLPTSKT